ncbi:hypothetical protein EBZ80_24380 [bacterium]|nr:hypothetical protein [bacterium]
MITETYLRPRPATHEEQMSEAGRRYEEQIRELSALAAKRFWRLVPENETRSRFTVEDQLGRPLYGPAHLYSLRGFFAGLPVQA